MPKRLLKARLRLANKLLPALAAAGVGMLSACSLFIPDELVYPVYEQTPERIKLRELAEGGSAEAQYRLAQGYCCGEGRNYNNEKALNWYCQAAKQGHRAAQFELGQMYEHAYTMLGWDTVTYRRRPAAGKYPKQNYERAYMWYTLANTEGKFPIAQNRKLDLAANHMTLEKVTLAEQMLDSWRDVPCGTSYMPDSDVMVRPDIPPEQVPPMPKQRRK